ncbi:MAG: hypothetical protein J3K34DRAFT_165315 [Monoraphidium minutum]|nr:MAG: hypothetical protein J3K34DRAFT_165315 [Monoraphidium minutum]
MGAGDAWVLGGPGQEGRCVDGAARAARTEAAAGVGAGGGTQRRVWAWRPRGRMRRRCADAKPAARGGQILRRRPAAGAPNRSGCSSPGIPSPGASGVRSAEWRRRSGARARRGARGARSVIRMHGKETASGDSRACDSRRPPASAQPDARAAGSSPRGRARPTGCAAVTGGRGHLRVSGGGKNGAGHKRRKQAGSLEGASDSPKHIARSRQHACMGWARGRHTGAAPGPSGHGLAVMVEVRSTSARARTQVRCMGGRRGAVPMPRGRTRACARALVCVTCAEKGRARGVALGPPRECALHWSPLPPAGLCPTGRRAWCRRERLKGVKRRASGRAGAGAKSRNPGGLKGALAKAAGGREG